MTTLTEHDYPRLKKSIKSLRTDFHKTRLIGPVCVDANALYDAIKALEQLADELEFKAYGPGG